jgi:hypothetical protein
LPFAEIADRNIKPRLDLPVGVFRETDRAGLGDPLQSRGNIDAIAHQVAVTLLNDVANMNANAELNAALRRKASVALDHAVLHFDGTTHGVNYAAELDESAVACALHDAAMMNGDDRID